MREKLKQQLWQDLGTSYWDYEAIVDGILSLFKEQVEKEAFVLVGDKTTTCKDCYCAGANAMKNAVLALLSKSNSPSVRMH